MASSVEEIGLPMSELEEHWLYEVDEELCEKYDYDESKSGKWMLFYDNELMDSKWAQACKLYREGRLTGISSMKTSTAKHNPRQYCEEKGVIIFYCGPYDDESRMKEYGINLAKVMNFYDERGFIAYKSDVQTMRGTRATGIKKNFLYTVPVPKTLTEGQQSRPSMSSREGGARNYSAPSRGRGVAGGDGRSRMSASDSPNWRNRNAD